MKPIAVSLLIGAACAGLSPSPAVLADSKTVTRTANLAQPLIRFERSAADVPPRLMAIYPENASVGFQPLFPSAGKQVNAPVATTGIE